MSDSIRSIADWFDDLVVLDVAARAAALATLDPALAQRLRALLAADDHADVAIDQAILIDAQAALTPSLAGQSIGPWRVIGELGSGGMGTVLLAEREQADFVQQVAIKLIRGFPSSDGMRRLRQERQILATLDHPNIARLIDGGETESGQPYLVVEYVRGKTLDAHVRDHAPDRNERISLIERIGTAVQHAHQNLVIHRDLKPANVMIRSDGEIKLLDFGVAKLLDIGSDGGSASTRVFTPGYASPEQRAGQPIGIASDVYSLGAMLHEILAIGVAPLQLDAELAGIIAKATAEQAHHRYVTVDAFCDDLRRYRLGLPIAAAADTGWYRTRKFIARHRIASAATALALVVIAALIWHLSVALNTAREQRLAADAARVQAEQSLQRSRSVVEFFAEMFDGVAPEHALGRKLAPSELLMRAEQLLSKNPPEDQGLRADLSTMLGGLYQRLGDGEQAVRLLQQGLVEQSPQGRAESLELASRHLSLSRALFSIDRRDEAMAEVQRFLHLRAPFAVNDPALQLESAVELAQAELLMRNLAAARKHLDAAQVLAEAGPISSKLALELADAAGVVAIDEGRFDQAIVAAQTGLDLLQRDAELPRTRLIQFERTLARALQASGRMDEAAAAFARAIAAQEQFVGSTGVRASSLYNDHAVLLSGLGRFRDAEQAYIRAADIQFAAGGLPPQRNPVHLNNLCDARSGHGDYAAALRDCRAALALHANEPADHPDVMIVRSNTARVLALTGDAEAALKELLAVRDLAAQAAGAESFPVALHTVRAVRAALLAGDIEAARRLGNDGVRLFEQLFPTPHPWRARALRFRGLASIAGADLDAAAADLERAATEAAIGLAAGHPLRAQIAADQAEIALLRGDHDGARVLLASAMPVLRACCSANEIDRARGEQLLVALDKTPR